MNRWKISFFVTLTASVSIIGFLLYALLDQGISYGYLSDAYDEKSRANEVLGNLIVKGGKGYSQKDILYILRQEYPKAFIVETDNEISMFPNRFVFEKNRLVSAR